MLLILFISTISNMIMLNEVIELKQANPIYYDCYYSGQLRYCEISEIIQESVTNEVDPIEQLERIVK
ncbi:MAG: hypothetical protein UR43_C0005G0015 [candidate division TM6 bacterium GW2011_GWF2_33_332]|nr:MAG: hypothetical protein UR43_C0005G0015 [candidate division TM6 bacterium GW2011_GWF2_33_332]